MDIHSPSLPQRPSTTTAQSLNELMEEKVILEGTLARLNAVLESHGVDMSTPLIDRNGFPRDDIDVAQIRVVRSQVIHLKNDHKGLMSRIEKGLHALHQETRNAEQQALPAAQSRAPPPVATTPALIPFALVNSVADSSPAAEAGLQQSDKVVKFGTVYAHNNAKLARLAEVVQRNEGREIDVVVLRQEVTVSLRLTPRSGWGGRGMLGCHLLPI